MIFAIGLALFLIGHYGTRFVISCARDAYRQGNFAVISSLSWFVVVTRVAKGVGFIMAFYSLGWMLAKVLP